MAWCDVMYVMHGMQWLYAMHVVNVCVMLCDVCMWACDACMYAVYVCKDFNVCVKSMFVVYVWM